MKNKRNRLNAISEILNSKAVGNQEELAILLAEQKMIVTQATLSRDLKLLKVSKAPLTNGSYRYTLPTFAIHSEENSSIKKMATQGSIISLEFSGQLAVLKTKPGYASAIAGDIDNHCCNAIIGTIAGDDTVLIIPKEGVTRDIVAEQIQLTFSE